MNGLSKWQRPDLSVWPTVGRLFGLREELDRLFEPFGETGSAQLLSLWNPAVDVYQDKDNVYVRAEIPGMKKEEIDVSLHEGVLSISGERKAEEKFTEAQTYRSERFVGRFHRSLSLPSEVNADHVKAHYADGVLTITLPKAEEAKPKQIEIKVN